MSGLLRKFHTTFRDISNNDSDNTTIIFNNQQSEKELEDIKHLLFHLSKFHDTISEVNHDYKPHLMARYTLDLCQKINSFYQAYRIVTEDDKDLSSTRTSVISCTQGYIEKAMELLGVDCIEEM